MADPKDKAATEPAAHDVGDEVSTRRAEFSTGPTEDVAEGDKTTTYYLKEGATHHHIIKGEARELNKFGDKADLTPSQYQAFGDKFHSAAEHNAIKAGREAMAEGAQAAELAVASRSQENTTPEETQANANDPKGAGKPNTAGQPGKPETK